MNSCLSMVFRPSSIVILLASAALIVSISLTPCWYVMLKHIEQRVNMNSQVFLSEMQSEIEDSAKLLRPMNSSSINIARLLTSKLSTTISFSDIETKVAPVLFQAFSIVPHLAEISYIGMEGFFFLYYTDHDRALAMYSNSSLSKGALGASNATLYYIQPVNQDTGKLYGEAITSKVGPLINTSWIEEVVNRNSNGYASMGTTWSNDRDPLFLSSAKITRAGVISLGFPAASITGFITRIAHQGSTLSLATKDGKVLVQEIPHTHMVFSNDMVSFQSLNPNGNPLTYEASTVSCKDRAITSVLNIQGAQYLLYCSSIDIMGVELVYVLAVPQNGLPSFVQKNRKEGLKLLIVVILMILLAISSFLIINCRAPMREMHLLASLIKQMEATQQAERRSMNKNLALASASHDVRASLAALTGLIEMSYDEVVPDSELDTNLKQMDSCTKDLLGLLNSILDTSKIEAGKMQLEEEEFDLSQFLEDVVDLFHPMAMKKGVDLVLDPCDGSVITYSRVKGDRGKLKQVLSNLLSNAIKFTDEGHIAVRAWGQKSSFQNSITASNHYNFMKHLSCLFYKESEGHKDLEAANAIQQDPNCVNFVFEVDDTGRGIPKEKHKSVFENYVQVKETALEQVGTGLGLGIVQSLVRLMRGDIGIVDKDMGKKGTCFKFNVLLTVCEKVTSGGSIREGIDRHQSLRPTIQTLRCSPRPGCSRVVLLIQHEERQRTLQKFMESIGLEVKVVKQWEHLFHTLKKIKQKGSHPSESSPDLSSDSTSQNFIAKAKGVLSSAMDGTAITSFILIVIDANAGPSVELCRMVSNFKKGLRNPCKVVWLNKPVVRNVNFKALDGDAFDPDDIVISKPFHGTRLFQVIRLLPEYRQSNFSRDRTKRESDGLPFQSVEQFRKETPASSRDQSYGRYKGRNSPVHQAEIQEYDDSSFQKALTGKRFLLVEDSELPSKVALHALRQLGATVKQCQNGEQAVKLVEEGLTKAFPNLPYDYILMDCEMPVMDGFEATRRIRAMEKAYGVHIPIIALSGHTSGNETKMTIKAGMDIHLGKPISKDHLLKAIRYIHGKG